MPIEFDEIYHTETMVRILRDQGSPQYAMELAREILKKQPEHQAVQGLLGELEVEARRNFEKFKNSGRQAMAAIAAEAKGVDPDREPELELEPVPSDLTVAEPILAEGGQVVEFPLEVGRRGEKLNRLRRFLAKIQGRKKQYEASQA